MRNMLWREVLKHLFPAISFSTNILCQILKSNILTRTTPHWGDLPQTLAKVLLRLFINYRCVLCPKDEWENFASIFIGSF